VCAASTDIGSAVPAGDAAAVAATTARNELSITARKRCRRVSGRARASVGAIDDPYLRQGCAGPRSSTVRRRNERRSAEPRLRRSSDRNPPAVRPRTSDVVGVRPSAGHLSALNETTRGAPRDLPQRRAASTLAVRRPDDVRLQFETAASAASARIDADRSSRRPTICIETIVSLKSDRHRRCPVATERRHVPQVGGRYGLRVRSGAAGGASEHIQSRGVHGGAVKHARAAGSRPMSKLQYCCCYLTLFPPPVFKVEV
jgi:hypothetical protein